MKKSVWQSRTKDDLMVEVWERLGSRPVGSAVLKKIQRVLLEQFGEGAGDGPASIARALADAGAEMVHPEVLEYDASWRAAAMQKAAADDPGELFDLENTWNLTKAAAWMRRLDRSRKTFERGDDRKGIKNLENRARAERQRAQARSTAGSLSQRKLAEAAEIAEWLAVWLQEPRIFEDWLSLRQRSAEYTQTFRR